MSDSPIRFGTDGWRAIIADEFTFANVRACAQATGRYFAGTGLASRGIVVGYDTRFASEEFAGAVAEVLAAHGIPVHLCDRAAPTPVGGFGIRRPGAGVLAAPGTPVPLCARAAPTPVVGFGIRRLEAGGGIVITSSHNPALYSGFKVRTNEASAAAPEILPTIEALIPEALSGRVERMPLEEAEAKGLGR